MAVSLKKISSKKSRTGQEVGRLMIKDLAKMYRNILDGNGDEGLLTGPEKSELVDSLGNAEDFDRYNEFRYVHEFLVNAPVLFSLHQNVASNAFWKIYNFLENSFKAENENSREARLRPQIVTQKQYDDMKRDDLNEKMSWFYSPELFLIHAVDYYVKKYKEGKRTPFNKYFTAYKKKPLVNQRIKNKYEDNGYYILPDGRNSRDIDQKEWQKILHSFPPYCDMYGFDEDGQPIDDDLTPEQLLHNIRLTKGVDINKLNNIKWVDDYTAPEGTTMFDVLENMDSFYFSDETDSENTIFEFMDDYSDFYQALWEKLSTMEGLSFLKDISKEQFFDDELISCKDLYENKIMDFKEQFDDFQSIGFAGVAILVKPGFSSIDENGYYKEVDPYWRKNYMADVLLANHKTGLESLMDTYIYNLRYAYAMKEAIKILGDFIEVPEIDVLLGNINEGEIELLNNVVDRLKVSIERCEFDNDILSADEIIYQLEEVFKPIKINDLKPSSNSIKEARRIVDFRTVQGNARKFISLLMGEDVDLWI